MRRYAVGVLATVAFLLMAPASPAAPPTLTGEGVGSTNNPVPDVETFTEYVSCVEEGDRLTLRYRAVGTGSGPYGGRILPGVLDAAPFEETAELTISPHFGYGGANSGDLVAFKADFTIRSDSGTISGTKSFAGEVPGQLADCGGNPGPDLILEADNLRYEAKIYTPEGEFRDTGTATFEMINTGTTTNNGNLSQQFTSELTATQPACSDGVDNDRDALVDFGSAAGNDHGCSSDDDADESDFLWGKATVGGAFSRMSTDVKRASGYLLWYDDATVTKLRAYIDGGRATSGSQEIRGVIYRVGKLVAETEPVTIKAGELGRWVEFPLETPVELDRGYYLLGLHSGPDNGVARYAWDPGQPESRRFNIDVFSDGASDPLGSAFTDSQRMAIFALGDTAPPASGE
jgi:hypothetical protein